MRVETFAILTLTALGFMVGGTGILAVLSNFGG